MNNNQCPESAEDSDEALTQLLRDKAYRLLARREYSARELREKFQGMAPPNLCGQVLQTLIDQGSQSDFRFTEMLCRSRFNNGSGPVRLRHELDQHGIAPALIERCMAPYRGRWTESAQYVRAKKFGDKPPADFKEWTKQARFLQQRGFDPEHIGQFPEDKTGY